MLKLSGLLFFLTLGILFTPAVSQADEAWQSPDSDTSLGHFASKFFADIPHLFIPDNAVPFFAGSLLTASDWVFFDRQDDLEPSLKSLNIQPVFDFGNFYGGGWLEEGAALGSWSLGALTQNLQFQEFGRDACETLAASFIVLESLKIAVNRTRPDGNPDSFPSGHSITAFCLAPVVNRYFGWQVGVPAYILATVTGFARVEGGYHYLSDVIAGATLGIVIGNAVVYAPRDVSVSAGIGRMNLKLSFN